MTEAALSLGHQCILRPQALLLLERADLVFITPDGKQAGGLAVRIISDKNAKKIEDKRSNVRWAINRPPWRIVNAPAAVLRHLQVNGLLSSPPETPLWQLRDPKTGYCKRRGGIAVRWTSTTARRQLRHDVWKAAGVPHWQSLSLRSLRPGGATDADAEGLPSNLRKATGAWKTEESAQLYVRQHASILGKLSKFERRLAADSSTRRRR